MQYVDRHHDVLRFLRTALAFFLLLVSVALTSTASFAANYAETFDSGTAQGWTAVTGTWGVAAGTYNSSADGAADITVYGGDSWNTDFVYHARINNQYNNFGNLAGVVYNYQDANNYYAVVFQPVGSFGCPEVFVQSTLNGTTTTIAHNCYSGGGPNVWFDMDVTRSGVNTTVKVNGVSAFGNIPVPQSQLGVGRIGLITNFAHSLFDNVSVQMGVPIQSGPHFPRLGAYPIGSPQNYDSDYFRTNAAKYAVLILSHYPGWQAGTSVNPQTGSQWTMADVMQDIKTRSTVGTKIFAYVMNAEVQHAPGGAYDPVWQKATAEKWWLYTSGTSGNPVPSTFPGNDVMNNTNFGPPDTAGKNWIEWKADFDYGFNVTGDANDAPNPIVDGFFLDSVFWTPRNTGDWNRDGTTDCVAPPGTFQPCNATESAWMRDGFKSYFDYIRSIWRPGTAGAGGLQAGNIADWGQFVSTIGVLDQQLDGGVMESMIGQTYSVETWAPFNSTTGDSVMGWYRKMIDACRAPKLAIFGHDNWNSGDWQGMRYGLATTLMDDGYYYISGTTSYDPTNLLSFDEFNFDLGYPIQPRQEAQWSQGVWRRDFDNGIVLVNPKGNGTQTVNLGGTFRKLTGTQDPVTNNGMTVTSVILQDRDGIILSR